MSGTYELSKKNLVACLRRVEGLSLPELLKDEEFLFYHKNRNYFNNKYESKNTINSLTQIGIKEYKDEDGHSWEEYLIGIAYHVKGGGTNSWEGVKKWTQQVFTSRPERWSRKFVRIDLETKKLGWEDGCSFELVLRNEPNLGPGAYRRLIDGPEMETYNYAMSFMKHKKYDVDTHEALRGYEYYKADHYPPGLVMIQDVSIYQRTVKNF
jgi:hypothetical protein